MCDRAVDASVPDFWIGVATSLAGSIILNGGLNLQRLAHIRLAASPIEARLPHYTRDRLWLAGFLIFLLGNLGDAIGLTFTPQSVITPIGSISLVSNLFFARLLLKEKLGLRTLGSVFLIVAGVVLIVISADSSCTEETIESLAMRWRQARFVAFTVIHLVALVTLNAWVFRVERKMKHGDGTTASLETRESYVLRLVYSLLASMWATWTVLLVKSIGEVAKTASRLGINTALTRPEGYLFLLGALVSAPLQVRYLNAGLQHFESLFIVPAFYSFWVFGSITVGALFFDEMEGLESWQYGVFVVGVVLNVSGVTLLAQRELDTRDDAGSGESALKLERVPSAAADAPAQALEQPGPPGPAKPKVLRVPSLRRLFPSAYLFLFPLPPASPGDKARHEDAAGAPRESSRTTGSSSAV